jgi:hypothetical protein
MAKGQVAKNEVAKIILDAFGDKAFLYNDGKEIRVNWVEAGEAVQIKVALTASKVAVEQGADTEVPGSIKPAVTAIPKSEMIDFEAPAVPAPVAAPTETEKQNIKELMARLGL